MNSKRLFALEGIDGSGKTTQTQILEQNLKQEGYKVFLSKSCPPENKNLLENFIEGFEIDRRSIAMMFLFQTLHEKQWQEVQEALEKKNTLVIADRWNASFWTYHLTFGPLRKNPTLLWNLDKITFKGLTPAVTFLLDLPAETAIARKKKAKLQNRFDQETTETFSVIQKKYLEIAKTYDDWVIIKADDSIEAIQAEIWEITKNYL